MATERRAPTPAQDRTLTEILREMADEGWTGDFMALEGGELRCLSCREAISAEAVHADGSTRVEGASDPADMAIVIPVTCTSCGARGTVVAKYGPEASPEEADLVLHMERRPDVPLEEAGGGDRAG